MEVEGAGPEQLPAVVALRCKHLFSTPHTAPCFTNLKGEKETTPLFCLSVVVLQSRTFLHKHGQSFAPAWRHF